jgi:hypothetical protein
MAKKIQVGSPVISGAKKEYVQKKMIEIWDGLTDGANKNTKRFYDFQRAFLLGAVAAAKGKGEIVTYDMPPSWYIAILRSDVVEGV